MMSLRMFAVFVLLQWGCSQREKEREQARTPEQHQEREKILLRTNTQEGLVAKDPRFTVESFLKEYKRPQKELDSIVVPAHLSVGRFLNRGRPIQAYYLSNDLTIYAEPDPASTVVYRDTNYEWSGYSKGSGDGYLVRSEWTVLEFNPEWVKVHYKRSRGWVDGRFFAANKIVVFDKRGSRFREYLSPFLSSGTSTVVAGEDSMSFYVSNYKDFYLKVDLLSGKITDTVQASHLIDRHLLKRSYVYTHLSMPEEDYLLLDKMRFSPSSFMGRFLSDRVVYIYKDNEFHNSLLSENYETGKVDTLFSFDRDQRGIAYQVESLSPLGNGYVVMSMDAYDARY